MDSPPLTGYNILSCYIMPVPFQYYSDNRGILATVSATPISRRRTPIFSAIFLISTLLFGCVPPANSQVPPPPTGTRFAGGTNESIILQARSEVLQGLRAYEANDWEKTRRAFDNAIDIIHRADLPETYKDLKLIQVGLPQAYRHFDLTAIHNQVRGFPLKQGAHHGGSRFLAQEPSEESSEGTSSWGPSLPSHYSAHNPSTLPEKAFLEREIIRLVAEFGEDSYTVPPVFVESVQHFVTDYQGPRRKFFNKALRRSGKYVPLITAIFRQKKVPEDMAYMALVESGYSPTVTSRAKARGLWQFIRSTGRSYGLRIDKWRDERLDPVKSTIAAREYFLDLVAIFGSRSFLLAMASYNAGEGKITSCLKRLDDPFEERNFWAIRGCLRRETREYIPRVIAAAIVAKYPERYGFTAPKPLGNVDWMIVTQPTRLSTLARYAGITEGALRKLNPDLTPKERSTPSRVINFPLAVPRGKGSAVAQALAAARTLQPGAGAARASTVSYRVRRGDNLWTIGRRFGIAPAKIAHWNGVKGGLIRPGQTLVMYTDGQGRQAPPKSPSSATAAPAKGKRFTYVVQKGNSLYDIGRYFGVPYRDIMRWNRLRNARIFPGQKLKIFTTRAPILTTYLVKPGDTLSEISSRHKVRLDYLMGYNGLSPGDMIRVNGKLKIYRFK